MSVSLLSEAYGKWNLVRKISFQSKILSNKMEKIRLLWGQIIFLDEIDLIEN